MFHFFIAIGAKHEVTSQAIVIIRVTIFQWIGKGNHVCVIFFGLKLLYRHDKYERFDMRVLLSYKWFCSVQIIWPLHSSVFKNCYVWSRFATFARPSFGEFRLNEKSKVNVFTFRLYIVSIILYLELPLLMLKLRFQTV